VPSDRELEPVRFEARELKPYGEPVEPTALQVGTVYFALTYLDPNMLLPTLEPVIYVGRDLEPGDVEQFYFQDADSYRRGIRYQSADGDHPAAFHTGDAIKHVFDYDRALDLLMLCSLRRREAAG
jgi:hypothetical protein